ncbi:MAG: hypothetical protein KDI19_13490 [Pseudomonadales bacterium]|nr:hypothetical protein [Pseudomonadales bacterium]
MSTCQLCDERPSTPLSVAPRSVRSRPPLFNWITILLVSGWVLLVAAVAEYSADAPRPPETVETMIDTLAH